MGADLVANSFFADSPLLWVVSGGGAAASLKGGCVFSGLQLYM